MELLTPREAARRLGVSYPTLKQWIYNGSIRTRRTAGRTPSGARRGDRSAARATGRALREAAPRSGGAIVALSGRNQLRGIVDEVRVDGLLAQVKLRVGDQSLTAIITRDAVDELKLRRGDEALAVIKSTEVMIARPVASQSLPKRPAAVEPRHQLAATLRSTHQRPGLDLYLAPGRKLGPVVLLPQQVLLFRRVQHHRPPLAPLRLRRA